MNLTLKSPLDMHVHLRQDDMLKQVTPFTSSQFSGAVCMPNTQPPVDTLERYRAYVREVTEAAAPFAFAPYVPLFFRDDFTREELTAAREELFAIKLYPAGVTTNSEGGVAELSKIEPVLDIMQDLDLPLLVHGETHGYSPDREREFVSVYDHIASTFPKLRLIMEHITTADAAEFLDKHDNVFCTVTLHHMLYTLDDMLGGMFDPFLFCKPILKSPKDRAAIQSLVLSGHKKVMFGSDSAPHTEVMKRTEGMAGCFTAPMLLPMLAEFFEDHDELELMQAFVSDNARRIYGVTPPERTVVLTREAWVVPPRYGSIVPVNAGQTIRWKLA
ncbi:dihydroorotase [Kiritimatiellaeota bacterium B1221]|nr:dihydroorotase [Kiritimatiellaeota bacterium B1221]